MDKLVNKFRQDPVFAVGVIIAGVVVTTGLLNAVARNVEAGGYAARAAKYVRN
jgi:hypothetical protein